MTPSKELPLARPKNIRAMTKAVDWREFCAPFSGSSALSPLGEEMTQKAPVGHSIRKRCLKTWDTSNRCLSPAPTPGQAWFRLDPAFDSEKPRPHSCPLYPSGSVSTFFWESVQITCFSPPVSLCSLSV